MQTYQLIVKVPNDFLDLRVPVYDLDAVFINDGAQAYVATAYQKVIKVIMI